MILETFVCELDCGPIDTLFILWEIPTSERADIAVWKKPYLWADGRWQMKKETTRLESGVEMVSVNQCMNYSDTNLKVMIKEEYSTCDLKKRKC